MPPEFKLRPAFTTPTHPEYEQRRIEAGPPKRPRTLRTAMMKHLCPPQSPSARSAASTYKLPICSHSEFLDRITYAHYELKIARRRHAAKHVAVRGEVMLCTTETEEVEMVPGSNSIPAGDPAVDDAMRAWRKTPSTLTAVGAASI